MREEREGSSKKYNDPLLCNLSAFTLEELSLEHKGYCLCIESMWEGFFIIVIYTYICTCNYVHKMTQKFQSSWGSPTVPHTQFSHAAHVQQQ